MIHLLWQATQVVFWLALFVLVAFGPWALAYFWWEDAESIPSMVALVVAVLWCAVAIVAGFIFLCNEIDKADSAQHRWRGGSGPDTHCEFEIRDELVGKVMQRVTYTVCD